MKQLLSVVLVTGVLLTGCVSTSTFDEKQSELVACKTRAKSEIEACDSSRSDTETKLAVATQ